MLGGEDAESTTGALKKGIAAAVSIHVFKLEMPLLVLMVSLEPLRSVKIFSSSCVWAWCGGTMGALDDGIFC